MLGRCWDKVRKFFILFWGFWRGLDVVMEV